MKSLPTLSRKLNHWLRRRPWRVFIFGLPAVLAFLLLIAAAALFLGNRAGEPMQRYERLAKTALGTKNFEVARIASLRELAGAKNERDRAQWIFYLAMARAGQGQRQDAADLVSEAAPLNPLGAGNLDAHVMVAQSLLRDTNLTAQAVLSAQANPTNATAKILHDAERHLLSALAIDPNSADANELLGRFYINTHQPEKARACLMKIYAARPETALLLALDEDAENNAAEALQWAERAITVYEHNLLQAAPDFHLADRQGLVRALAVERKYTKQTPGGGQPVVTMNPGFEDSPAFWLGIVRLLAINGKYKAALQTLEQRQADNPNPEYAAAIGDICLDIAQSISPKTKGGTAERLQFIEEGITNAPGNLELMFLLAQAADATDETGPKARVLLESQKARASKAYIGYWHFEMAREADLRGDKGMAREELKTACKLAPQDPLVAAQSAYYELTSTNREDWAAGLKIIDAVLKACPPGEPHEAGFRGTRGLLLARMGRGKEAAADLEFAVKKMPEATEDQQALAKINGKSVAGTPEVSVNVLGQTREMINNGDFATAAKTLEQYLQGDANPSYATALADVCAAWADYLPVNQHAERLRIIQKGLSHDPRHPKLQAMLIEATHASDASGQAAADLVAQLAAGATGEAAAEWRLLWGQDARKRGDLTAARKQLELAYRLEPQNTRIEIELARVLATGQGQDLTEGLGLIEQVLAQFPDRAEFREIRGQILLNLNRNQDALAELSFAVERLPDPKDVAETRRMLVKVYDALGKPQKAEEEKRLLLENP